MRALGRSLALGAILAVCSEFWFYPVAPVWGLWMILAIYALGGAMILAALARYPRSGPAGAIVAGGLMGLSMEGVVVPVLFEAPPFSILWTSLAWHALLSFGCGVWGLRVVLQGPMIRAIPVVALGGALLGVWGGFFWQPEVSDAPPTRYAAQMLGAWAVFVMGHALLDLFAGPPPRIGRLGLGVIGGIAFGIWALMWGLSLFPVSLLYPLLMALSVWALHRGGDRGGAAPGLFTRRLPLQSYPIFALIPAVAIPVQAASLGAVPELNAWWILVTGPIAAILWLGALWVLLRGRDARGLSRGVR